VSEGEPVWSIPESLLIDPGLGRLVETILAKKEPVDALLPATLRGKARRYLITGIPTTFLGNLVFVGGKPYQPIGRSARNLVFSFTLAVLFLLSIARSPRFP